MPVGPCADMFRILRISLVGLALVSPAARSQGGSGGTPPTVWGYASPSRIVADVGTTVVRWGSFGADHCSYGGSRYPASGSARLGPYSAGEHSATFSCTGPGGTTYKTIRWTAYVPEPEVFASVRPAGVYTGQTATLSWRSTNAASCSRGGTSGSVTVGPWSTPGAKPLSVTCTGAGGRDTDTVSVTVTRAPRPVITASLSPAVIEADTGTTTGAWSATNADYCTYGGDRLAASGRSTLGPYPAGTRAFTFTCTGPGGTSPPKTLTLRILSPPTATAMVSPARVKAGAGTATLTWSSENADSCSRGGRTLAASGSESVGPFTNTTATVRTVSFTVACANDLRSASGSASLTVDPALPTVAATVSSAEVVAGTDTATLTWTSTNAASCSYGGAAGTTGSVAIGPYDETETGAKTFTVTCTNGLGSVNDSATLTVVLPAPVFDYVGFDHHYKAWRKPRSYDYFIGRDPSAPGNGGVTGFYLREARIGKTNDHFYNLEYPVTNAEARADGFTIESSLSLELHDVNLDGRTDLIIEGLVNPPDLSDVIVYARAGSRSPPAAGYTEMGPAFRRMMTDLNSWNTDDGYFDDNATERRVPVVNRRMIEPTAYTERPTTLPGKCQDGRHYCEVVHGSDGLPPNPTPMGFEYVYRPETRGTRDGGGGIWDDFLFGDLFYIAVFRYQEVFTGSGSGTEYVTELDYGVFNGADEIAVDIDTIRDSENAELDEAERGRVGGILGRIFGPDIGGVSNTVYKDGFFITLSLWASSFAAQTDDVMGSPELDGYVEEVIAAYDLLGKLAVGNNEYVICFVRKPDGTLDVRIWPDNNNSPVLDVGSETGGSFAKARSYPNGDENVAILHTHPESNYAGEFPNRPSAVTRFISNVENACRELPGPGDHDVIEKFGIPNYILPPTGTLRVLERSGGEYEVRTVTEGGARVSAQIMTGPGASGRETYRIPAQEDFRTGRTGRVGDCNR